MVSDQVGSTLIPKSNPFRSLNQNWLVVLIKSSQNLLSSQLRQQLLNIIVKSDQATLDDLQRSNSSQQLSLRSEQKDSVVSDVRSTLLDRSLASSMAELESACESFRHKSAKANNQSVLLSFWP
jgi:hypothetical protein